MANKNHLLISVSFYVHFILLMFFPSYLYLLTCIYIV